MFIIPALHIKNGKCVSLYKGRPDQMQSYGRSPLNQAREFQKAGASLIHVVDMDGSLNGGLVNFELIQQLVQELKTPIEVGGAVRTMETLDQLMDAGVARVVLGVSAEPIMEEALKKYGPNRIILGIKARRHKIDSDSLPDDQDEVLEVAEKMVEKGFTQIIYSDMERQGTLYHPNYDEVDELIGLLGDRVKIYSSGGTVILDDLRILNTIGTHGVIIGRALMEYKISLKSAIDEYETDQDRLELLSALGGLS